MPSARLPMPSGRLNRPLIGSGPSAIAAGMLWIFIGAACSAGESDLDAPVTATWSGVGLREWAARISDISARPVLVDRRLDPDTAIRLECRGEPLRDVLSRGAAAADGEVATLRSSIRIVPRGMASVLARAESARDARLATLPPRQRSALAAPTPWQWRAGARPRDLVADAAAHAGITLDGVATVPHDHLPAASLPAMTLAEGLDMLLAAYDVRIEWQAGRGTAGGPTPGLPTGRIVAIDTGLPPAASRTAAARPPDGKPSSRPAAVRPKPAPGKQTFSLQVAAPLDELLAAVATRLELKLDLDHGSLTRRGIAPGEIVRTTVKDASRDELLDAILDPLQLDWKIEADTLRVFAQ